MTTEEKFDLSEKKQIIEKEWLYHKLPFQDEVNVYPEEDVKEFIRREINRRQRQIDILVDENSGEFISRAEELEEELNQFKKDAGDKLI